MKNMLIALAAYLGSASAAKAPPLGDCVSMGDEFCDAHIGEDHPSLVDGPWTYAYKHGDNWPKITEKALGLKGGKKNECGGPNQSPIDLKHSWAKKSAKLDNFQKWYNNPTSASKASPDVIVDWNGHTSQTYVDKAGTEKFIQTFESQHGKDYYQASERYSGLQFHFHHGSEHTVEGKRHDLEMHTVHLADEKNAGNMFAAAMGIMFSVDSPSRKFSDKEVAVVDAFFDSLQWEKTSDKAKNVKVPQVSYGELMMMVDMDNRWTYRGSVTTPPCAENVYWNVVRTVYPIKRKHLKQFIDELSLDGLEKTGNFRLIQPLTDSHKPIILVSGGGGGGLPFLILFVIFAVISIALLVVVMKLHRANSTKQNSVEDTPAEAK